MRTRNKFLAAAMGLGVATLLGSTALAAPVSVRDAPGGDGIFASAGLHQTVSLKVTNVFNNFVNYDSGVFGLQQSTDSANNFPNNTYTSLITYCLEIGQSIGQLPFTYQSQAIATALASGSVVPPSANATQAAERIARLWAASFADSIDVASTDFEGLNGISTSERAAAFQIAIWELAVDNAPSGANGNVHGLLSGNFQIESGGGSQGDVLRMANAYLAIAKGTSALANIEALADNTRQDLIRPGGGGNGQAVPAPGSLALFGAGMIALAAIRRRKKG